MADMTFKAKLLPFADLNDSYTLGSSSKRWKIFGDLTGNAASATYATNVRITETNPSSATTYYPNFTTGVAANTNYALRGTKHYYLYDAGTAATGVYLNIGAANYKGGLTLHTNSSYYGDIAPTTLTANRTYTLPDVSGWVATGGNGSSTGVGSSTIPVYLSTTGTLTAISNLSLIASDTSDKRVEVGNSNGTVKLLASTNRGMYDTTNSKWICYTAQAGDHTYIPLWASKGSSTQPVYFNSSGEPVAAGAYSGLLTALSWTAGTTSGPTLSITVGGTNKTATIPSASKTASGVVTTGNQDFKGIKGFDYMIRYGRNGSGSAVRWVADTYLYNDAGTQVGEFWYDCGDAINITTGQYVWSQYSPNSTANTSTTGKKENYKLPVVASGLTENKNYTIITTKNPADLGYYLPLSGGTMTGWITFDAEQGTYARIKRKKADGGGWAYAPYRFIGNDNNTFANIGVYGSADTLGYIYIGAGDWNSTVNLRITPAGIVSATKVRGAVFNDYAEYRQVDDPLKPGSCVHEVGDGSMIMTTQRLQRGCKIISDTYGFDIGETEICNTPIAVSGRVLAYIYEGREEARKHIGYPVCSGPNGTISIMTDEEEEKYPSRIVGTISEIPDYDVWGSDNIKVDGRIWIYVR